MSSTVLVLDLNYKQESMTRFFICVLGLFGLMASKGDLIPFLSIIMGLLIMLWNPKRVYVFTTTIGRDLIALNRFMLLNLYLGFIERRKWTVARTFQDVLQKHPEKFCYIMDQRYFSFQQVENFSNRVASYFKEEGFKRGDCVALFMEARLEYIPIWLGLSKIGVITALLNTNLRKSSLEHALEVSQARSIIIGSELKKAIEQIVSARDVGKIKIYQFSDEDQRREDDFDLVYFAKDLTIELRRQQNVDLCEDIRKGLPSDKLLYIFTSGTTGMPKAAVITNMRFIFMASGVHHLLGFKRDDIIYNPLPLYHTAGGVVNVGNALIHGCTVVLRKKFSISGFWSDCITYDCTIAQYIGELCRYLLSAPRKPEDSNHNLRMMFGNGLRIQIWQQFKSRFNIPRIAELYGSTEGNSNLVNITNKPGAVGFIPPFLQKFSPIQVVKCDDVTGEVIRNKEGLCTLCQPGEVGLLVGKIDQTRVSTAFHGYVDKRESEKKVLKGVLHRDDYYFDSGDLVICDIFGYIYFKDRLGDTFRYRGENVSTAEVEAIITNVIGLKDCVVFGVEIPHVEGKVGMAVILDPTREVDLYNLSVGIRGSLPSYAIPVFIRIVNEMPYTSTFKMKKFQLQTEGFNKNNVKDPVYYFNKDLIYRPLTMEQLDDLLSGKTSH